MNIGKMELRQLTNLLTKSNSELLYSTFLSGDGNFHLQLMLRCKDLFWDPSLFGDSAFFTPIGATTNYINSAGKIKPAIKVHLQFNQKKNGNTDSQQPP